MRKLLILLSFVFIFGAVLAVTVDADANNHLLRVFGSHDINSGDNTLHQTGATAQIRAGHRPGYQFNGWTANPAVSFVNAASVNTSFTMPAGDVQVQANWVRIDGSIESNTHTLFVLGSHHANPGGGIRVSGNFVQIRAGVRPGYRFVGWSATPAIEFANYRQAETGFTMPNSNVTVQANWVRDDDVSGMFLVTVVDAFLSEHSHTRFFAPGQWVHLHTSYRPNFTFDRWTTTQGVNITNQFNTVAGFVMPENNVNVVANWTMHGGSPWWPQATPSPTPIPHPHRQPPSPTPAPTPMPNVFTTAAPIAARPDFAVRQGITNPPQINHQAISAQISGGDEVVFLALPINTSVIRLHGQTLDLLIANNAPLTITRGNAWVQMPQDFLAELREQGGSIMGSNGGTFDITLDVSHATLHFVEARITFATNAGGISTPITDFDSDFNFVMDLRNAFVAANASISAFRNGISAQGTLFADVGLFILPSNRAGNFTAAVL